MRCSERGEDSAEAKVSSELKPMIAPIPCMRQSLKPCPRMPHNVLREPTRRGRRRSPMRLERAVLCCCGCLLLLGALAGCGAGGGGQTTTVPSATTEGSTVAEYTSTALQVSSPAFEAGGTIPKKYTGEGRGISPPLTWGRLPERTKELALICDDPDAPRSEPFVHWVVYKIPADSKGLPEGSA